MNELYYFFYILKDPYKLKIYPFDKSPKEERNDRTLNVNGTPEVVQIGDFNKVITGETSTELVDTMDKFYQDLKNGRFLFLHLTEFI